MIYTRWYNVVTRGAVYVLSPWCGVTKFGRITHHGRDVLRWVSTVPSLQFQLSRCFSCLWHLLYCTWWYEFLAVESHNMWIPVQNFVRAFDVTLIFSPVTCSYSKSGGSVIVPLATLFCCFMPSQVRSIQIFVFHAKGLKCRYSSSRHLSVTV